MKSIHKFLLLSALACLFPMLSSAFANAQSPSIFYSDITSGPASGGENSAGAYVTLYGNYFGSAPGSVTIGGVKATNYKLWGSPWLWYQKLTFQVPAGAPLGATTIQVTTANGNSNTIPFTIRAGNIYCVSTSGSNSNSGKFPSCWSSITNAKSNMVAGDITYVENGVAQTAIDDYNASLAITSGGTAASPIALLAYPGATATIGTTSIPYGLRTPAVSGSMNYWVIGGMTLRGLAAMDLLGNTGWRVVGNDFSCPLGSGQSACLHTDTNTNLFVYGNNVHNVGDQAGSIDKYFHAVYFTTNTNHVWVGWNDVAPNPTNSTTSGGCRAVQFYSTGGSDQFDLHVFDNRIHDAICDGINFATVNPNNGTVEAYDNVVYHVGTGPDPYNGSSNYSCVLAGSSGTPTVPVKVYNNTFYDCGSRKTSDAGALAPDTALQADNNIVYQLSGESYVNPNAPLSSLSGSKNIWYGVSGAPSQTTGNLTSNPLLANPGGYSFSLQSGSPAIDAGIATTATADILGVTRPQGTSFDIGAYEAYTGSVTAPTCDLNGDGVVNTQDVSIAVSQSLGETACTNADLDQDTLCTVIDVQRVVNASMGLACRVGP